VESDRTEPEGTANQGCTDALVDVDYRFAATFDGGLPSSVTVTHDATGGTSVVAETEL
jgi:hypothetical protein